MHDDQQPARLLHETARIREAYDRDGELSAAMELRRRFPGNTDNATAREQARGSAAWLPPPYRRIQKGKTDARAGWLGPGDVAGRTDVLAVSAGTGDQPG